MSKKKDSFKPWLSRPAINRSVTIPFTTSLTHRLSSLGEFHPNDLDPFLLFDARDSMIGTLENPTLDLDPSKPDTLNVITATRAGTATFTDVNGLIASAPANTVRVDYTQGAELTPTKFQHIGYTDFSSPVWVKNNSTLTLNQETAPDGTDTAAKYLGSGTGQDLYYDIDLNGPFTFSFFVKYINAPYVRLRTGNVSTWFNLTTGNIATQNHDSATIQDVGDGWFRVSGTTTSTSSFSHFYIHPHATDNTTFEQDGGSFYVWGPQVEEGTTASDFVENTTGSPKFITGPTFGPRVPMILVEPSAINQTKTSEDFNSSEWTHLSVGQGSTPIVTDSYDYSPDGTQNATRLQVALNGGNTVTDQSIIYDIDNSNTVQTISVWMKSNTNEAYNIYLANTYTGTGTDIAQVTPQWQRFSFSHTTSNHTFSIGLRGGIGSSDSADILIWGAQGEAGSVATSYIPTSGSTVTRAADNLEITGSAFTDFFSSSEGTFYAEYQFNDADGANSLIYGSADNQRFAYKNLGSSSPLLSYDGVNVLNYGRLAAGTLLRTALSFDSNTMEGSQDGSAATMSNQTAPFPHTGNFLTASKLHIGSDTNGGKQLNGHIKRLIYWPTHSDSL